MAVKTFCIRVSALGTYQQVPDLPAYRWPTSMLGGKSEGPRLSKQPVVEPTKTEQRVRRGNPIRQEQQEAPPREG